MTTGTLHAIIRDDQGAAILDQRFSLADAIAAAAAVQAMGPTVADAGAATQAPDQSAAAGALPIQPPTPAATSSSSPTPAATSSSSPTPAATSSSGGTIESRVSSLETRVTTLEQRNAAAPA